MTDYFMSPDGLGVATGLTKETALSFNKGKGFSSWVEDTCAPGDVLTFVVGYGPYLFEQDMTWPATKSGTLAAKIIVQGEGPDSADLAYGAGVPEVSSQWPVLDGGVDNLRSFINLAANTSHITLRRFQLTNIGFFLVTAEGGNTYIELSSLHGRNMAEFCRQRYDSTYAKFSNFLFKNIYGTGIRKRVIHATDIVDSRFENISVNTINEDGSWFEDWALYYRFDGYSSNIDVIDCHGENASVRPSYWINGGYYYVNGDAFTTEEHVSDIRFLRCIGVSCGDAAFDCKGGNPIPLKFTECVAVNSGHRSFRFWDETYEMINCRTYREHWYGLGKESKGVGQYVPIWAQKGTVTCRGMWAENMSKIAELDDNATVNFIDSTFVLGVDIPEHYPGRTFEFTGQGTVNHTNSKYLTCLRVSAVANSKLLDNVPPETPVIQPPSQGALKAIAPKPRVLIILGGGLTLTGNSALSYPGRKPNSAAYWSDRLEAFVKLDPTVQDNRGYRSHQNTVLNLINEFEITYPDYAPYIIEYQASGSIADDATERTAFIAQLQKAVVYLGQGLPYYYWGIVWAHGQEDMADATKATAYAANLESILSAIRTETSPGLKAIALRTSENFTGAVTPQAKADIRAAQEAIGDWINTDDLIMPTGVDGIARQLTSEGYAILGKRIFLQLNEYIPILEGEDSPVTYQSALKTEEELTPPAPPAPAVQPADDQPVVPGTGAASGLSVDFTTLTTLPSDWTQSARSKVTVSTAGLDIVKNADGSDWLRSYAYSPVWDMTNTLSIYFNGWDSAGRSASIALRAFDVNFGVTRKNDKAFSFRSVEIGTDKGKQVDIVPSLVRNTAYRADYAKSGDDISLTLYTDDGTGGGYTALLATDGTAIAYNYVGGAAKFASAKVFLDSNDSAIRVTKVVADGT